MTDTQLDECTEAFRRKVKFLRACAVSTSLKIQIVSALQPGRVWCLFFIFIRRFCRISTLSLVFLVWRIMVSEKGQRPGV